MNDFTVKESIDLLTKLPKDARVHQHSGEQARWCKCALQMKKESGK